MDGVQSISGADLSPLLSFIMLQQNLLVLLSIFGGMLLFMVAEQLYPRLQSDSVPAARWLNNWLLAFLNYFVVLAVMSSLGVALWIEQQVPTLPFIDALPVPVLFVTLVLSVEFVTYWAHRMFHSVPALWRIHAVHHMDTDLDVTTSHRHHFLEVLVMAFLITPFFVMFGVSVWIAFLYQVLRVLVVHFNHSNLRIPASVDRFLQPFIVTSSFHRVHHSSDARFTNSNYGSVVPWFDHLFGTVEKPADEKESPLGLGYLASAQDGRLDRVLLLPFLWRLWVFNERS